MPSTPAEHQGRDDGDQPRAQHVRPQQHLPAAPAVQPDAGEGADERVRQQQDGEARRDVDRIGRPLRVEQHRPRERGLEDAVAELGEQPGEQEPPEVPAREQVADARRRRAPVPRALHPVTLSGPEASTRSPPSRTTGSAIALSQGRPAGLSTVAVRRPPRCAGLGHTGIDDPGARVARSRVRTAHAARGGSTPRPGGPRALHRRARRRPSRQPAGRHAGPVGPHVRRNRRLRARPFRERHPRRRARPAQPGRHPRRAARLVRPGRRAVRVPRGRAVRDRHRALPGRRPRRGARARRAACAGSPATSTWSISTTTPPSCRSSPACGCSPGTPAGRRASWPARSSREPGPACPARADDVLSDLAGPDLWRAVMGRQTGRLAVLSTAPADPTAN